MLVTCVVCSICTSDFTSNVKEYKIKGLGCTYLHSFVSHLTQLAPHKMVVAEPQATVTIIQI